MYEPLNRYKVLNIVLRSGSDKLSHFTGKYFCLTYRQSAFNNEETKRVFGCIPH